MKGKRAAALLLILALLLPGAFAADCGPYSDADVDGQTLEQIMTRFREQYGLDESNFSFCYRNTVTGEQYCFNERWFAYAASTYKLPLNLYFYEMENAGEIDPDAVMTQGRARLSHIHEESILNSNNELTFALISYLGGFEPYKRAMLKFFSVPEAEIEEKYYYDHIYCTEMMLDVLQYLYDRQEQFPELLGYMKQAVPEDYFRKYITDCEVAHKYGDFKSMRNDVGIVYADQPFLLVVFTLNQTPETVSLAAALAKCYTDHAQQVQEEAARLAEEPSVQERALPAEEQNIQEEASPVTEPSVQEEVQPAEEPNVQEEAPPAEEQSVFVWWMIPVALGVFLLGGGGIMLGARRKGRLHEMLLDAEQEQEEP